MHAVYMYKVQSYFMLRNLYFQISITCQRLIKPVVAIVFSMSHRYFLNASSPRSYYKEWYFQNLPVEICCTGKTLVTMCVRCKEHVGHYSSFLACIIYVV